MIVFYAVIGVILICAVYAAIETFRFKTTDYEITDPKLSHSLNGKTMLVLSDLHGKSFGKKNCRLLRAVAELKPDIIIIAGDLVNGKVKEEFGYAHYFLSELLKLNVPVYYEFGNHELKYRLVSDSLFDEYCHMSEKVSQVLHNDSIRYFSGRNTDSLLNPAGRFEDHPAVIYGLELNRPLFYGKLEEARKQVDIEALLGKPDKNCYNILIAHDPSFAEEYFKWGADLILSGHYHGGIIRLPFIGGLISPRMKLFPTNSKGMVVSASGSKLIISGGLGWHTVPFRFLNTPEIVRISFKDSI